MADLRRYRRVIRPGARGGMIERGYRNQLRFARRRRQAARRIRPAQRGYVRTAGFYGRFTGAGGDRKELKFHDVDVDDAVVAQGTNIQTALLVIAEGNGEEQRVGRNIFIKRISWRYDIDIGNVVTSAASSDVMRVMMVLDQQCNGALPANTDLLESDSFLSFNNLANSSRFRVLMDKTYAIACPAGSGRGSTDTLSYGEQQIHAQFHKRCNIKIEYDNSATSGVITSIRSNNVFILLATQGGVAGFTSKVRFRYTD